MGLEFYRGRKVLVTGHTGFKGSWLCKVLAMNGASVCGYSLEPPTTPSLYELADIPKCVKSVIGDIRDLELLTRTMQEFQPEIVIHMAAQPIVRESYADPVYTYQTNVMGTVNVCEAVRRCGSVRSFVNVTTDKVYKNNEWEWGYRGQDNPGLCASDGKARGDNRAQSVFDTPLPACPGACRALSDACGGAV